MQFACHIFKKINVIHQTPYHMNFQQVKNKLKIQSIKKYPRKPKYDPKKFPFGYLGFPNGNPRYLLSTNNEIIRIKRLRLIFKTNLILQRHFLTSCPRRRASRTQLYSKTNWIPAFAGITIEKHMT